MSDTPRTDAIIVDHPDDIGWMLDDFIGVVDARFARQLETELQTMTALAERLAEVMKNSCNFPGRDWLEAQASAKGHSSVGKWADAKGRKAPQRKGNAQGEAQPPATNS